MRPDSVALGLELGRDAADADIEVAAGLGHVPAIARQAMLEEPEPAGAVLPVVGELLLEHGRLLAVDARRELAEQRAVDRAARPAGADQVPRAKASSSTYQPVSWRICRTRWVATVAPDRRSSHASNSTRRIECCIVRRLKPNPLMSAEARRR